MKSLIILVVTCYAAVASAMFLLQRRMMYFPSTDTPAPARYGVPEMEPVQYETHDRLTLTGWYRPPSCQGGPVIIYFHGNAGHYGDRADKARPYIDAGFGVLLVGYRGYGGNPGEPSETGFFADGEAVLAFLARQGIEPSQRLVYGESLGSGVAVYLASTNEVAGVVLEAPFTSAAAVAARHYWYLPVRALMKDKFDSLSRIRAVSAPVLIFHSDNDGTIPPELSMALFDAANEPKAKRLHEGAGHTAFMPERLASETIEFFESHTSACLQAIEN